MRTSFKRALMLTLLLPFGSPLKTALAADPVPTVESEEMAKAADEKALAAAKQGRSAEALEGFTNSYRLKPNAARLWRLAITELETSHPVEALAHFRAYVNEPNADGKHMAEAPGMISEAYHLSGHIRLHAPDGARIYLDGSNNGVLTDREVDIMPGHHVARVGDADPVPVVVAAGQLVDVDLMRPPPASQAPGAKTGGQLDEQKRPSDEHEVPASAAAEPKHGLTGHQVAAIAVGGGAVVGLGAGIAFALASQGATNDGNRDRAAYGPGFCVVPSSSQCQTVSNKIDQSRAFDTAAWISYGLGGVLAAGAVALALWPETTHEHPKAAWVMPLVGPQMTGVGAGGTF